MNNKFGLFDFIDWTDWYEIFDFQTLIDFSLFDFFIKGYESDFDPIDINTIYNNYRNKKITLKIGIDLYAYDFDYHCIIHFWINDFHFKSIYRIAYNIYNYHNNTILLNGSIPNRIKLYYQKNFNNVIYYKKS